MNEPYIRSQSDLLAELNVLVRDGSNTRWTAAEKYAALNQVLMTWAELVKLEHIYTISGGWQAATYEYALPSYVRPPIYPELLRRVPDIAYTVLGVTTKWQDVPGWELVSDGNGGQVIRLSAPPRTLDGQVAFYSPNSRVPTTIPVTSGSTSSTATTMLISTAIDIDDVGYIKCESEYIAYYGVTRGASTTTLNNLIRGLNGSTAATHAGGSSVYWCVGVDDLRLWRLLFDQWKSSLAELFLQDGGTHERAAYQQNLGFYSQLAANFWAGYSPKRRSSGPIANPRVSAFR